jgi:hypothetical protein
LRLSNRISLCRGSVCAILGEMPTCPSWVMNHKHVGFEIENQKRDRAVSAGVLKVWLNVETKLPVRIEFETLQSDETLPKPEALILVTAYFNWRPDFPAHTFTPQVQEDFRAVEQR